MAHKDRRTKKRYRGHHIASAHHQPRPTSTPTHTTSNTYRAIPRQSTHDDTMPLSSAQPHHGRPHHRNHPPDTSITTTSAADADGPLFPRHSDGQTTPKNSSTAPRHKPPSKQRLHTRTTQPQGAHSTTNRHSTKLANTVLHTPAKHQPTNSNHTKRHPQAFPLQAARTPKQAHQT